MSSFISQILLSLSLIASCAALLFAAPEISVDSADFEMGIVREGAIPSIEHAFIIKNTGDAPLKISKVKPSCGCTAVGHDTVIAPGKKGQATAKIKLSHFRPGHLRKYITVFSNAGKKPELSLSLACTIRSDLSIEPAYVRMTTEKDGTLKKTFTVITNKKDLHITQVDFIEDNTNSSTTTWQNQLPIAFSHTLTGTENSHPDGFVEFNLEISLTLPVDEENGMYGKFILTTDHPTKNSIELRGNIEPPVKK